VEGSAKGCCCLADRPYGQTRPGCGGDGWCHRLDWPDAHPARIRDPDQKLARTIGGQQGQSRFVVVRNSFRILALCAVYIAGFQAIGRRRGQ
jgi:hypothetical protein